jgi:hypothetical protein
MKLELRIRRRSSTSELATGQRIDLGPEGTAAGAAVPSGCRRFGYTIGMGQ